MGKIVDWSTKNYTNKSSRNNTDMVRIPTRDFCLAGINIRN